MIETAAQEAVVGRWDLIPVDMPDRMPAAVAVTGDKIWLLTDGGIASYTIGSRMRSMSQLTKVDAEAETPDIIGSSLSVLPDRRVLAGTIWRELFLADGDKIHRLSERGISGVYGLATLSDGHVAVAIGDRRPGDDDVMRRLEATLHAPVVTFSGYEALATSGDRIFAFNGQGVDEVNVSTGRSIWSASFGENDRSSLSAFHADAQYLYVATTQWYVPGGCYRIALDGGHSVDKFFSGNCYDLFPSRDGTVWASTETGIFRLSGDLWKSYYPAGIGGLGVGTKFAEDDAGNLWAASSLGLWRHYDYVRDIKLPSQLGTTVKAEAVFAADAKTIYVAFYGGRVFRRRGGIWHDMGVPAATTGNAYYRHPIFAGGPGGTVWLMTDTALYKVVGEGVERVAATPDEAKNPASPSALTICPDGGVYLGFLWQSTVYALEGAAWRPAFALAETEGGSAVAALNCADDGTVWALGRSTVAMREREGKWLETQPLRPKRYAKGNLFGALTLRPGGVTAWGVWGYPTTVELRNGVLTATQDPVTKQIGDITPYIYRRAQRLSDDRQMVLSDSAGLYLLVKDRLERLPLIDRRYQLFTEDFAAWPDAASAIGASLHLVASGHLFEVDAPQKIPLISVRGERERVFKSDTLNVDFLVHGPVGPPEAGRLIVSVEPPVSYQVFDTPEGDGYKVALTGASNGEHYRVTALYIDAAGQDSLPETAILSYELPWFQNPWIVAPLSTAAMLVVLVLFRNRYVADFLVRRVLGRKWRLTTGPADRRIALALRPDGRLVATVETAGATLKGSDIGNDIGFAAADLRQKIAALSDHAPRATDALSLDIFTRQLDDVRSLLDHAVPPLVAHELQAHAQSEIQFDLERGLSDLPWEMLTARNGAPLLVSAATSRVVVTDSAPAAPAIGGALNAVIFAATDKPRITQGWLDEQLRVASALRGAGVRNVRCFNGQVSKSDLLSALSRADLVHLIGHGEIATDQSIGFRLGPDALLSAGEIRQTLATAGRGPSLVFVNACGSLEERRDSGGKVLAGLATPFVERGAIVVGSLWPVQSLFATRLAISFYEAALPPPSSYVFRMIRGQPLAGKPLSAALLDARRSLFASAPDTNPTWSAYTIFGNVKARLELV